MSLRVEPRLKRIRSVKFPATFPSVWALVSRLRWYLCNVLHSNSLPHGRHNMSTANYIHDCPVAGCGRTRKSAQNMCSWHWATVPQHLQLAVLDMWDATVRAGRTAASWQAYLTARDEALATVPGYDRSVADQIDREGLAEVDSLTTVNA